MRDTVIKVEQLSKQYRLGLTGTGTLSHDLKRWLYRIKGKQDPFLKIGEANDRTKKGESEYVWSLKDINFEVHQGEVLGIIGRNGAGKSTLLKILSKVTSPTTGRIKIKGRIASLLEVGTGFHPELTGKENIFLNGAILGMTKREIRTKLDEIIDFSGVERYIDTPVKRYSSGMYVRLAFAVAAHLEPEILIVDEVLAVGDAEFQKKCLGKMQDVAGHGRTVLFVSHNMTAVETLCDNAIFLTNGRLEERGPVSDVIGKYLSKFTGENRRRSWNMEDAPGNDFVRLLSVQLKNTNIIYQKDSLDFEFVFAKNTDEPGSYSVTIQLADEKSNVIIASGSGQNQVFGDGRIGIYKFSLSIPGNILHYGHYTITRLLFVRNRGSVIYEQQDALSFEIQQNPEARTLRWMGKKAGIIHPLVHWNLVYGNDYEH